MRVQVSLKLRLQSGVLDAQVAAEVGHCQLQCCFQVEAEESVVRRQHGKTEVNKGEKRQTKLQARFNGAVASSLLCACVTQRRPH